MIISHLTCSLSAKPKLWFLKCGACQDSAPFSRICHEKKKKKNCVFHGIQNPTWLSPIPVQIRGCFPNPKVEKCQERPETWHKLGLHPCTALTAVLPFSSQGHIQLLHLHTAGIILPAYPPNGEAALPPCSPKFVFLEAQGIGMEKHNGSLFQSLLGCKMATTENHQLWPISSYMDDSTNSAALTTLGQ